MSRLIDADALKYEFEKRKDKVTSYEFIEALCEAQIEVDFAPTVDVEPLRHGEWIRDTDHHWDSKFKCSKCEYETEVDTCFGKPLYNYCPYCGARMDGERRTE